MIRDRMTARGFTQLRLASSAGMSQPTLSRCLSGISRWEVDDLVVVCQVLGTTAPDVLAVAIDMLGDRSND